MPRIGRDVCKALERAVCEGPMVRLAEQDENALDERVDRVLTASRATWSFRHRAYVFADLFPSGSAADLLKQIIMQRRTVRPDRGMVSCPQSVADRMCDEIGIGPTVRVLEPSAGHGILAAEAAARGASVDCYELDHHRAEDIRQASFAHTVTTADFLAIPPQPAYDVVLMYPPHRRDIASAHIVHAYQFLRPGGTLVALVAPGLVRGRSRAARALAELYERAFDRTGDMEFGEVQSSTGIHLQTELLFLYRGEEEPPSTSAGPTGTDYAAASTAAKALALIDDDSGFGTARDNDPDWPADQERAAVLALRDLHTALRARDKSTQPEPGSRP
ncbi:hypothetical protein [Streptomyces sp. NPDC056304]|uniref:hypothetical protein n=1 Tax=Streptomyces sp. NPDC056304 TaxID=3345778 RepID=UPI0035DB5E22